MPNRSSKADHIPVRTCVICKTRFEQSSLLSFYLLGRDLVIDMNRAVSTRKKYVCTAEECLSKLPGWLARQNRKSGTASGKKVSQI
jgi:predicted RNA-binding protein YlxR (DUF448 family)